MTLSEIADLAVQRRRVQQLKLRAKQQAKQVKDAQLRLRIEKARATEQQSRQQLMHNTTHHGNGAITK